ncbi:Eye-specific diacylglycerol kinase [Eumeta japonica]|uniref:Eye-specific diacylglycerol kinase n=1 Tax=Eumeta variegata TaxID=151549 RepID=A0A4C1VJG8_EUMVA|nr:Eye-specific diacylglycerol kinase [Eumeta japonica]
MVNFWTGFILAAKDRLLFASRAAGTRGAGGAACTPPAPAPQPVRSARPTLAKLTAHPACTHMQRLRTTFTRSRTPTPADMKTQSSLEVPKQVRSASFDEIQLEAARGAGAGALLAVPQTGGRSRSFDSAGSDDSGTYLEVKADFVNSKDISQNLDVHKDYVVIRQVPRLFLRRKSGKGTPPPCVHCRHMETWSARRSEERSTPERPLASSSAEDDDDDDDSDADSPRVTLAPPPASRAPPPPVTCSPPPSPGAPSFELQPPADEPPVPPMRRRSISRQEAFFVEPTGNSLENVRASEASSAEGVGTGDTRDAFVHDIYLAVPELKRDRAASVDSCFSKVSGCARAEELSAGGDSLTVPTAGLRSRSVDIVLPTAEQARYKALALAAPPSPTHALPHPPLLHQDELPILEVRFVSELYLLLLIHVMQKNVIESSRNH